MTQNSGLYDLSLSGIRIREFRFSDCVVLVEFDACTSSSAIREDMPGKHEGCCALKRLCVVYSSALPADRDIAGFGG